jgi:undecaprenyl diphosphate synthase
MIKHVAIIPDGNRRWARKKGFPPYYGHRYGFRRVKEIYEKSLDLNIPYLTFWFASEDNLTKRPKEEIKFLIKTICDEIETLIKKGELKEKKVRLRVLGRFRKYFPPKIVKLIEKTMKETEKHKMMHLTILLAYNGTEELLEAVKRIVSYASKTALRISWGLIKKFLWTKDLPPVDLVIRTGCEGDPHNSAGFMMYHTAYSQFYFTKTLFPDFTQKEFENAIKVFLKRERRMGA